MAMPGKPVVKNTFIHFESEGAGSEDDFDMDHAFSKRQQSEPAPGRQISRESALQSQAVQQEDDMDSALLTDGSLLRQCSEGLDLQTPGFDRQESSFSVTSFCRQVTDLDWPSWHLSGSSAAIGQPAASGSGYVAGPIAAPTPEWAPTASAPAAIGNSSSSASTQQEPAKVPLNAPHEMPQESQELQKESAHGRRNRNRRKAKSLICQAQRAQLRAQNDDGQEEQPTPVMATGSSSASGATFALNTSLLHHMPAAVPRQQGSDGESAEGRKPNFCPMCGGWCQPHFKFCQFCGASVASMF